MANPRRTVICPDGVDIKVNWRKFVPGTSIFIPCINTRLAVRQLLKAAKIENSDVEVRVCVESGRYGVRVWRIK